MREMTDWTILLDTSGSMYTIAEDMEGAIQSQIDEQRQYDDVVLTLITFSGPDNYDIVIDAKPLKEITEPIKLRPHGTTALTDAWCKAIDATGIRLASMEEEDRPENVLFTVVTDGEENDSRRFTKRDVEQRITEQTDKYNWKFEYLGANQVAKDVAYSYGMTLDKSVSATYTASGQGVGTVATSFKHSLDSLRDKTYKTGDRTQDS